MNNQTQELFDFIPQNDRAGANRVFALIKAPDTPKDLKPIFGSWLLSRLLGVFRTAQGATHEDSNIENTAVGSDIVNISVFTSGSGKDSNAASEEPIFVYKPQDAQKEVDCHPHQLATDIAAAIRSALPMPQDKSHYVSISISMVETIISYCLFLIGEHVHSDAFLNGLCLIQRHQCQPEGETYFWPPSPSDPHVSKRYKEEMKLIITSALHSMKHNIQSTLQAREDFQNLWQECSHKSASFLKHFGDSIEDQRSAITRAWLLHCALHLKGKCEPDEISLQDPTQIEAQSENLGVPSKKERLISIAACISFLANSDPSSEPPRPLKRPRIDTRDSLRIGRLGAIDRALFNLDRNDIIDSTQRGANSLDPAQISEVSDTKIVTSTTKDSINDTISSALHSFVPSLSITQDEIHKKVSFVTNFAQKLYEAKGEDGNVDSDCSTRQGQMDLRHAYAILCRDLRNQVSSLSKGNLKRAFCMFQYVQEESLITDEDTLLFLSGCVNGKSSGSAIIDTSTANTSSVIDEAFTPAKPANRVIPQTVQNSALELNAWMEMLLSIPTHAVKPSQALFRYLKASKDYNKNDGIGETATAKENESWENIVQSLNKVLDCFAKKTSDDDLELLIKNDGELQCSEDYALGEQNNRSYTAEISRAFIVLYYRALEAILRNERDRLRSVVTFQKLLMKEDFHMGLMTVCLLCVMIGPSSSLRKAGLSNWEYQDAFDITGCCAYDYMKVSEPFIRSMTSHSVHHLASNWKLPQMIICKLHTVEEAILLSKIWAKTDSAGRPGKFTAIMDLHNQSKKPKKEMEKDIQNLHPNGEANFVNYLLSKTIPIATRRISLISAQLSITCRESYQILKAFNLLLNKSAKVFYDNHLDSIILCLVYGICKATEGSQEIMFSDIIQAYCTIAEDGLGQEQCQRILRRIHMKGQKMGNVIQFYNHVILPLLEDHLLMTNQSQSKGSAYSVAPMSDTNLQKRDRDINQPTIHFTPHKHGYGMSPQRIIMKLPMARALITFGSPKKNWN